MYAIHLLIVRFRCCRRFVARGSSAFAAPLLHMPVPPPVSSSSTSGVACWAVFRSSKVNPASASFEPLKGTLRSREALVLGFEPLTSEMLGLESTRTEGTADFTEILRVQTPQGTDFTAGSPCLG